MIGLTPRRQNRNRDGFSLVELLVAIAIIAILAALAFPAGRNFFEKGRQIKCAGNLKQIGSGFAGYLADNNGVYPLGRDPNTKSGDPWGGPFWADMLETYTGSESSKRMKAQNLTAQSCFYCPSTPLHHQVSDYGVNPNVILVDNLNKNSKGVPAARLIRPSQTILALDAGDVWAPKDQLIGSWYIGNWIKNPTRKPATAKNGPLPRHGNPYPDLDGNFINVLFCDGSVQTMSYEQLLELQRAKAFEIN